MDRRTRGIIAVSACLYLGLAFCASTSQRRPSFPELIRSQDEGYRGSPVLRTAAGIFEKRRALQASLLEEFSRDPDGFVRRIAKKDRHFLFDAVVDGCVMMRVGRPGDGGKWIYDPETLGKDAIVYSFGVGEDISFDTGMAGLFGSRVFLFDPNPDVAAAFPSAAPGYPCGAGRLYYAPTGLGPVSAERGREWNLVIKGRACPVQSLGDIARGLGHDHVDVLKIDIEGGEFAVLREILSSGTLASLGVKMLLVEFHVWDTALFGTFLRLFTDLDAAGYRLYRKEFNPTNIRCAEYAFVKLNP
jgi:FkbM family methyltransferase